MSSTTKYGPTLHRASFADSVLIASCRLPLPRRQILPARESLLAFLQIMAPTRTHSHPPRPLDVARTSADRMWIHSGNTPEPALVTRVESEFREMPGLSLTVHQAARLFHLAEE